MSKAERVEKVLSLWIVKQRDAQASLPGGRAEFVALMRLARILIIITGGKR